MTKIVLSLAIVLLAHYANATLKGSSSRIYIGTALNEGHLGDAQYKSLAAEQFNMFTAENSMKWDAVEKSQGTFSFGGGDQVASFAATNGKLRGHTLLWHTQIPGYLNNLNATALGTALKEHIDGVLAHYKGKAYAWDVVNEIFDESGKLRSSVWSQKMGEEFVSDAFKWAKEADATPKLYINDYNIEPKNAKSNGLYDLVKKLKGAGVPIEGVGFQSHFSVGGVPADFAANLQRFIDLGCEVAITELDIKGSSASQQAQDYAKVFKTCHDLPKCVGVTIWGITDKYSWITSGSPLPWDSNYQAKAAVAAIEAAVK